MERTLFQEIAHLHIDTAVFFLEAELSRVGALASSDTSVQPSLKFAFAGVEQWLGNWNDFRSSTGPMGSNEAGYALQSGDVKAVYGAFDLAFKETFPKLGWCDRHQAVRKLETVIRDVKASLPFAARQTAEQQGELCKSMQLLRDFCKKASNTLKSLEPATA